MTANKKLSAIVEVEHKKIKKVMTTENTVGIQTRAMMEAQCMENEAQRDMDNNQEGAQGENPTPGQAALDPTMNPTVELHKTMT